MTCSACGGHWKWIPTRFWKTCGCGHASRQSLSRRAATHGGQRRPDLSVSQCGGLHGVPRPPRYLPDVSGRTRHAFQGTFQHIGKGQLFPPPGLLPGRHETQTWTLASWADDQEAATYNQMTARWAAVKALFEKNPWDSNGMGSPKGKMAFMAAYNIDRFREFVFQSSFLKRYRVKKNLVKKTAGQRSGADAVRLRMDPHVRLGAAFIQHPLTGRHARIGAIFYPPPPRRC